MSGVTDRRETRLNLSAIRVNRGLSLHDIAEQTKIGTRYLEAIETERFEWLPGLVYSTSYIRQYAKAIDYDPEAILTLYEEMIGAPDTRDQRDETSIGRRCWSAITAGSCEWLLLQYAEIDRKYRVDGPSKRAQ